MQKERLSEKNKGITIVALIITIIIMLILIGVSVTVSIDGNLFNKAQQATTQTQSTLDRKALLAEVVWAIGEDGKVDFTKLDNNLQKIGFEKIDEKTYRSEKGNIFIVDDYGNITN